MNRIASERDRLDADLENLERMLPVWREKLRHEAQFWPQFDVLAQEILARADPQDYQYAQLRIGAMLTKHAPKRLGA
jgi:hypothetical protein